MRQALILVDEIKRKKEALKRKRSDCLINDYTKSIKRDMKELKDYCKFKGLDFGRLEKLINE